MLGDARSNMGRDTGIEKAATLALASIRVRSLWKMQPTGGIEAMVQRVPDVGHIKVAEGKAGMQFLCGSHWCTCQLLPS